MVIAVMQPYFIPYAGYFRLFSQTDTFVLYDCVQFPRRGWVHRNRLRDALDRPQWLTLPLEIAERDVLIGNLSFAPDAAARFVSAAARFPALAPALRWLQGDRAAGEWDQPLAELLRALTAFDCAPVDYLERQLVLTCAALGLHCRVVRSSSLRIPAEVRGQDRILAIARTLGARCYLNAPGGRALYQEEAFRRAGIELRFLEDYRGPTDSILQRLLREQRTHIATDIRHPA